MSNEIAQAEQTLAVLNRQVSASESIVAALVIETQDDYDLAAEETKSMAAQLKAIEEKRFAITRPMDEAKARIMDLFRGPENRLKSAIAAGKNAMLVYHNKVRAEAAEKQRIANEEARQQRIKAEEEALRVAQAAAAKAEEARRQQQEAEAAGKRALEAAQQGDEETMELALAQQNTLAHAADAARDEASNTLVNAQLSMALAQSTLPAIVTDAPPKTAGISVSTTWDAKVTDKKQAVAFILAHWELYQDIVTLDSIKLRALARAQKQALRFNGVVAVPSESIRTRTK